MWRETAFYVLYGARANLMEIGLLAMSAFAIVLCALSLRTLRRDLAVLARNGADAIILRQTRQSIRAANSRLINALFFSVLAYLGLAAPARIPPTAISVSAYLIFIAVVGNFIYTQLRDRADREAMIGEALALRRREERAVAGRIAIDHLSVIHQFNAAAERIFGYAAEEVLGRPLTNLIPERYRDAHLRGVARAYAADGPSERMGVVLDLPGLRKDGTEVPLHIVLDQTVGLAGRMFVATFTEDLPDRPPPPPTTPEDQHRESMTELVHNTSVSTEGRDVATQARDVALLAYEAATKALDIANHSNEKVERSQIAGQHSADRLHDLVERLEVERQEREDE